MKKLIFSVSVSGAVLLSFLPLAAQTAISSSGNVTGAAEGVNDVSATLKDTDGRRIVSATASGYRGKTGEVVNDAMAKTGDAQRSVPQYLSYTLILSGEIAPNKGGGEGAGEGGPETYSATRRERGKYWIELVSGARPVIPVGGTTQFIAKSNSNPTGEISLWTIQKDGAGGNLYSGGASVQITTPSGLEASKYSVEGTAVASPNPISGTEFFVVEIVKPAKNGASEKWGQSGMKYDCQVIKTPSSVHFQPSLPIRGNWAGRTDGYWTVSSGVVNNPRSNNTAFRSFNPVKGVVLNLFFPEAGSAPVDSRTIDVYQDYLELGRDNFGVGRSCNTGWKPVAKYGVTEADLPAQSRWNCHGSTAYFANGNMNGDTQVLPNASTVEEKTEPDNAYWNSLILNRGDIVAFYSGGTTSNPLKLQHSHTSMGNTIMYGANNEPTINPQGASLPGTWKWHECTSREYYNAINSSWLGPGFLTKIRILRK